jgi:hypothetical protein
MPKSVKKIPVPKKLMDRVLELAERGFNSYVTCTFSPRQSKREPSLRGHKFIDYWQLGRKVVFLFAGK